MSRKVLYTLDTGHYHPTETITDKISAVLMFLPEILLHVSRGVRWDSDHVVVLSDDLGAIAQELVRGDLLSRTHIGLDYFDASINRVAAWVIGARNTLKALLQAMVEPTARLRACEEAGDYTARLALLEEIKRLPWGAVWDQYCSGAGVPTGQQWLDEVKEYESTVLAARAYVDGPYALTLSPQIDISHKRHRVTELFASTAKACVAGDDGRQMVHGKRADWHRCGSYAVASHCWPVTARFAASPSNRWSSLRLRR